MVLVEPHLAQDSCHSTKVRETPDAQPNQDLEILDDIECTDNHHLESNTHLQFDQERQCLRGTPLDIDQ